MSELYLYPIDKPGSVVCSRRCGGSSSGGGDIFSGAGAGTGVGEGSAGVGAAVVAPER